MHTSQHVPAGARCCQATFGGVEGSCLVLNPAVLQLGAAHSRRPAHSCANMDPGLRWKFV